MIFEVFVRLQYLRMENNSGVVFELTSIIMVLILYFRCSTETVIAVYQHRSEYEYASVLQTCVVGKNAIQQFINHGRA